MVLGPVSENAVIRPLEEQGPLGCAVWARSGIKIPNDRTAAKVVAYYAAGILQANLVPIYEGARKICWNVTNAFNEDHPWHRMFETPSQRRYEELRAGGVEVLSPLTDRLMASRHRFKDNSVTGSA